MSETSTHEGATNRQGGRGRRRRGGRNRGPQAQGNSDRPYKVRTETSAKKKPTGLQKLINVLSFGLLGKSDKPAKGKPAPGKQPTSDRRPRPQQTQSGQQPRPPRDGTKPERPRREFPPAAPEEVQAERLYVGNLSYDASESDLFELFNGVGRVQNAEVVVNNRTQRSKGFAFVTMGSVEEARRAVIELHGKEFMGRPLQVNGAKPQQARDGSSNEADSDADAEEGA